MINSGDLIDSRYRLVEKIGSGGMADVFEAEDIVSNQIVAIKILKEELLNKESSVKDFQDEVKISSSMSHPNIVKVFNGGVYQNRPYIVIEYFKEQTLANKLSYLSRFSLNEAIDIMCQVLDAVDYTHKHGLIHRDIKPQNIFYLPNGIIKLGDFGIATNQENSDKRMIGSIYYLAPEVCSGRPFSIRSDIYALGITFYELIVGSVPFDSPQAEIVINNHINKEIILPSKIVNGIPKEIDEIILKATAKNIGERYYDVSEFLTALNQFKNGTYKKENFITKLLKKL